MQVKALIFDFRVFAPIEINYQKGWEVLMKESKSVNPLSKDFLGQLGLMLREKKKSEKESEGTLTKMSELLDEIETTQIADFSLYPGVKNGLESLKTMKLKVAATTELGTKASEKFLKEKEIKPYITELFSRPNLENGRNLGLRISNALQKLKTGKEESIYFCNQLEDLIAAKSANVTTVILPSKGARMDAMLRENPDGMIMTLEELPAMLSLEKFKKPMGKELSSKSKEQEAPNTDNP
jgi:phosphoglycolate phosphatase-like HAD superfamily hydrolase